MKKQSVTDGAAHVGCSLGEGWGVGVGLRSYLCGSVVGRF